MYHSLLIHSSADGHLGCSHVLALINSAAMNIGVHVSLSILVPSVRMFGIMVLPAYISVNNVQVSSFLHALSNTCSLAVSVATILKGVGWYLIVALNFISLMISDGKHFVLYQ